MAIYLTGEKHYNFIKLLLSKGASLADAKVVFRVASVAAEKGMINEKDAVQLEGIRQRLELLERMGRTSDQAKAAALLKFKTAKNVPNREEHIGEWLAGLTGQVPYGSWTKRFGPLVAHSKPYKREKPRKGTFRQKAGTTIVTGTAQVLKDLKHLMDTLGRMIERHGRGGTREKELIRKASKSVTTKVGKV